MQSTLNGWGNSIGLRIPKSLALELGLESGSQVDVQVQDGALVIRPARRRYTIEELVDGMTPEDMREADREWMNAPPVGRELL